MDGGCSGDPHVVGDTPGRGVAEGSGNESGGDDAPRGDPVDAGLVAEVLANHGLGLLVSMVQGGLSDEAGDPVVTDQRKNLARMLSTLPVVCSQAAMAMRNSPSYAAIMFYERTRLMCGQYSSRKASRCFFDGLPHSLPMFGAPVAIQFPVDRMRDLQFEDTLNERLHTIGQLEKFPEGSVKMAELAQQFDHLPDLSPEVPLRVRLFISRTRTMCEGMRACKPGSWFRQCNHQQCARLFMVKVDALNAPPCNQVNRDSPTDHAYWEAIAPIRKYSDDSNRFCSRACASQWWLQIRRLTESTIDSPRGLLGQLHGASSCDLGSKRVDPTASVELSTALSRNGQLKSAIAKLHKRRRKVAPAVARFDIDSEVVQRITRANVDLGVLYASVKARGVAAWGSRHSMPGDHYDWRQSGKAGLGGRARRLYDQFASETPIHDMLKGHSYLRACAERPKFVLGIL